MFNLISFKFVGQLLKGKAIWIYIYMFLFVSYLFLFFSFSFSFSFLCLHFSLRTWFHFKILWLFFLEHFCLTSVVWTTLLQMSQFLRDLILSSRKFYTFLIHKYRREQFLQVGAFVLLPPPQILTSKLDRRFLIFFFHCFYYLKGSRIFQSVIIEAISIHWKSVAE